MNAETGPMMVTEPPSTPDCEPHTPHPRSYVARSEWFEEMAGAGFIQRKCRGCGLWMIWDPPVNPSSPVPPVRDSAHGKGG